MTREEYLEYMRNYNKRNAYKKVKSERNLVTQPMRRSRWDKKN